MGLKSLQEIIVFFVLAVFCWFVWWFSGGFLFGGSATGFLRFEDNGISQKDVFLVQKNVLKVFIYMILFDFDQHWSVDVGFFCFEHDSAPWLLAFATWAQRLGSKYYQIRLQTVLQRFIKRSQFSPQLSLLPFLLASSRSTARLRLGDLQLLGHQQAMGCHWIIKHHRDLQLLRTGLGLGTWTPPPEVPAFRFGVLVWVCFFKAKR